MSASHTESLASVDGDVISQAIIWHTVREAMPKAPSQAREAMNLIFSGLVPANDAVRVPADGKSATAMIRAASQAAFFAPALPTATVATGMPPGIWTVARSASRPSRPTSTSWSRSRVTRTPERGTPSRPLWQGNTS